MALLMHQNFIFYLALLCTISNWVTSRLYLISKGKLATKQNSITYSAWMYSCHIAFPFGRYVCVSNEFVDFDFCCCWSIDRYRLKTVRVQVHFDHLFSMQSHQFFVTKTTHTIFWLFFFSLETFLCASFSIGISSFFLLLVLLSLGYNKILSLNCLNKWIIKTINFP